MQDKTKINPPKQVSFFLLYFILIAATILAGYIAFVRNGNFRIIVEVSCDPKSEKCYKRVCDPTSDSTCPQDEAKRISYYKKISKTALSIQDCEKTTEKVGCGQEPACASGEQSCSYIYCDANKLEDGESCAQ